MVLTNNSSLTGAQQQLSTASPFDVKYFHDLFYGHERMAQSAHDYSIRGSPLLSQPFRSTHRPVAPHAHYEAVQNPREGFQYNGTMTIEVTTTGHLLAGVDIQFDLNPITVGNTAGPSAPGVLTNQTWYTNGYAYALLRQATISLNGGDQYERTTGDAFQIRRLLYDLEPKRLNRPLGFGSDDDRSRWAYETQRMRAPLRFGMFEGDSMSYDSIRARQGQLHIELQTRAEEALLNRSGTAVGSTSASGGVSRFAFVKNEVRIADAELSQMQLTHGAHEDFDLFTYRYTGYRVVTHANTATTESVQLTIRNLMDTIVMFCRLDARSILVAAAKTGFEYFDWAGVSHPVSGILDYPVASWSLTNGSSLTRFNNEAVDSDLIRHRQFASNNDDRTEFMSVWSAAHTPTSSQYTGGIELSGETNTTLEIALPADVNATTRNWTGQMHIYWFSWMAAKYYTEANGGLTLTKLYAE